MASKKNQINSDNICSCGQKMPSGNPGCAVYGIGFAGAVVYFFQHESGFSGYLWGLGKAIVWPAMLVYRALELLRM